MHNLEEKKNNLLQRLKTTQGHLGGVIRMLEEEKDCLDILTQISAIKAAVNKIEVGILKNYLHKCLQESLIKDDNPEQIVDNLSKVLSKFLK